ncbi:hypothetical protein L2E82_29767 [Cichorium intybus]|uniref:Uncharacterized protein n=1 Tax=Cichorium intybus TaxID=13427 RepID=A0ACB9CYF7_CICIN|nr:hypothetical protein L2E82_29767 [Cichorium intybus]
MGSQSSSVWFTFILVIRRIRLGSCLVTWKQIVKCVSDLDASVVSGKKDDDEGDSDDEDRMVIGSKYDVVGILDFNSTEISGKLMKLLSRNLSITEKLEGEDKDKVNYNKDFARMERYDQIQDIKKNKNQHQIEQRITRSQLRFMEENIKRRTRANSRITRSGNSSTSITVTQRLEEVGTTCGMKKGKIGSKEFNNCSRKGALIGNQ